MRRGREVGPRSGVRGGILLFVPVLFLSGAGCARVSVPAQPSPAANAPANADANAPNTPAPDASAGRTTGDNAVERRSGVPEDSTTAGRSGARSDGSRDARQGVNRREEARGRAAVGSSAGASSEEAREETWGPANDPILTSPYASNPDIQEQVEFWMEFWQGRGRGYFQRYLHRMVLYHPLVDRELKERGLPWSLRYLPVIESGYSPTAVSRVGATGLWQFMSGTARWLGLRVDGFVDERRDPYRATETALDYLVTLNEDFGSWFLALAAYNSGPGRVGRILRRHAPDAPAGDSLFWALTDRFPNETSYFVPKLLAASELAANPARYGFDPPNAGDSLSFDLVEVPDATSLDVVAEAAGVETEDVVGLNPQLVQRVTPVRTPWTVRVPPGHAEGFATRLAEIPPEERVTFVQHRVASGETLSHIAERYGVRVSQLSAANPGVSPRRLQIGQRLIVPTAPASSRERVAVREQNAATPVRGNGLGPPGHGSLELRRDHTRGPVGREPLDHCSRVRSGPR